MTRLSDGRACACRTRSTRWNARPIGSSAASATTLMPRSPERRLICGCSRSRPGARFSPRRRSQRCGLPGTAPMPPGAPPSRASSRRIWRCRPRASSAPWLKPQTASTPPTRRWRENSSSVESATGPTGTMTLKGRTLFITGASRGIGLAIALRAARDGANVAIAAKTDKPHPKLSGTIFTAADEIAKAGGQALPLVVDVRDEAQVKGAIEKSVATFGGIDIVVNNASAVQRTPVVDTDMRRFDLMHQINARGTFMVSKYAIPHLEKAHNPHILMNSPPLDMREKWFSGSTAYSIAKYGMSLVVLGLAGELRDKGIAVNALWPRTTIATAAIKNLLGGERVMRMSRTPEIIADAAYLVFQKPSRSFTGNFLIDDTFLAAEGITDFEKYRMDARQPLAPTFFVPDDAAPPPGVSVTGERWE